MTTPAIQSPPFFSHPPFLIIFVWETNTSCCWVGLHRVCRFKSVQAVCFPPPSLSWHLHQPTSQTVSRTCPMAWPLLWVAGLKASLKALSRQMQDRVSQICSRAKHAAVTLMAWACCSWHLSISQSSAGVLHCLPP